MSRISIKPLAAVLAASLLSPLIVTGAPGAVSPAAPLPAECLVAGAIIGTDGDDVIDGTNGSDVICGLGGNDTIDGANGGDVVFGGDGDDTISTGNGADVVDGGFGDDTIATGNGDDVVRAGFGNDTISTGRGDDFVIAGDGDDTVELDRGDDVVLGDTGIDGGDAGQGDDTCVDTESVANCEQSFGLAESELPVGDRPDLDTLVGEALIAELLSAAPIANVGFKARLDAYGCIAELDVADPAIDALLQAQAAVIPLLQGDGGGTARVFAADRAAVETLVAAGAAECGALLGLSSRLLAVRQIEILAASIRDAADPETDLARAALVRLGAAFSELHAGDDSFLADDLLGSIDRYEAAWTAARTGHAELWAAQDGDGDLLRDEIELRFGTDPTAADTDGDGLADLTELWTTLTDPTAADTDGDGIDDGASDPDEDGLDNVDEVGRRTDPLVADTDGDGVDDGAEVAAGTDPLSDDTDDDGLSDSSEARLGTDPFDPDTDDDGVLDGDEIYDSSAAFDVGGPVTVTMTGVGDVAAQVEATNESAVALFTDVPGMLSVPVDLTSDLPFTQALIEMRFDPAAVPNGDLGGLALMWFDEEARTWVPLGAPTVDPTGTVAATATHFTTFAIFYVPNWQAVIDGWDPDLDGGGGGDPGDPGDPGDVPPVDVAFAIDSSGSMRSNDRFRLRVTAAQNFIDALIEGDRVAVVDFTSWARVLYGLGDDLAAASAAVNGVRQSGGTNIYAGVNTALAQLESGADGRSQILILLTDGYGTWYDAALTRAQNNGVKIYSVGLGANYDRALLERIADETGGAFYAVANAEDLPEVFSRIGDDSGTGGDGRVEDLDPRGDEDDDGLLNGYEIDGITTLSGKTYVLDPLDRDSDDDGIEDAAEFLPPSSQSNFLFRELTAPDDADTDDDGIVDGDELILQSNPYRADTDGDGLDDGTELDAEFDPFDPNPDGDSYGDLEEYENGNDPFGFELRPTEHVQAFLAGAILGEAGEFVPAFDTKVKNIAKDLISSTDLPYVSDALGIAAGVTGELTAGLTCAAGWAVGWVPYVGDGFELGCEVLNYTISWRPEWASSISYLAGAIAFALIPLADIPTGIRDAVAAIIKGDLVGAGIEVLFAAIGLVPGVGDAISAGKKVATFILRKGDEVIGVIYKVLAKALPDDLFRIAVKQATDLSDETIDAIGGADDLKAFATAGDDVGDLGRRLDLCTLNSIDVDELVLMADGSTRPMRDVAVGDEVVSVDPLTGATVTATVQATTSRFTTEEVVDIVVAGGAESLTLTLDHEVWSDELGDWIPAAWAEHGLILDGVVVDDATWRVATIEVGDLDVDGFDTFVLVTGDALVTVHNADCSLIPGLDQALRGIGRRSQTVRLLPKLSGSSELRKLENARDSLAGKLRHPFSTGSPPSYLRAGAFQDADQARLVIRTAIEQNGSAVDGFLIATKPRTLTIELDDVPGVSPTGRAIDVNGNVTSTEGVRVRIVRSRNGGFRIAQAAPVDPLDVNRTFPTRNVLASRADAGQVAGDPNATGGVYVLVRPDLPGQPGGVVRTGRTNDFARRADEHAATYPGQYEFVPVYRTDDLNAQIGLEQRLYDQYPILEGNLNQVQPIGASAAGWPLYSDAADALISQSPL